MNQASPVINCQGMSKALDEFIIEGLDHNIPLLRDIMDNPNFKNGAFDTKFLETQYSDFQGKNIGIETKHEIMTAASYIYSKMQDWKMSGSASAQQELYISLNNGVASRVSVSHLTDDTIQVYL